MNSASRFRLGVDVGGTHTDLVLLDVSTGDLMVEKVSSTPKNPALGVLDGVARIIARGIRPQDIGFFAHGTTITTNALLEMRGAKVGLFITKGFRAVQEVQNQARDGNLFDYFYEKPVPIAPQSLTKEIPERADYLGNVLVHGDPFPVLDLDQDLEGVPFLPRESPDDVPKGLPVHGDGNDGQVPALVPVLRLLEGRHFGAAQIAENRPEEKKDRFP